MIEALQIDQSLPAFHFRLVAEPNEWRKSRVGVTAQSDKALAYKAFFQELIDELREKKFTSARLGQLQNWYSFASGVGGVKYNATFAQNSMVRAEVYFDGDEAVNKDRFDSLFLQKDVLERRFGGPLVWERLDGKIASRISATRPGSIDGSPEELSTIREWLVSSMLKLKEVFGSLLLAP